MQAYQQYMKQRALFYITVFVVLLTVVNCAKTGTPTGGEKDTEPPKVVKEEPAGLSTNFEAEEIRIYFDEYIKLKDLQKQLIVSPPLKNLPEISPQGSASKYLEIKIKDTLLPNTTYVFNFGQSITDNNEGNPYEFYKYVFSTGDYIDSLSLYGMVKDAVEKNPDQFVSVMLYEVNEEYKDSIVYNEVPTYITNTLDSAVTFQLTNLKAGTYKLVAMKDVGNNNLFNQKTDKIAFLEEEITVPTDSVYLLTLFKEIPNFRASRPSLASGNRMIFGYEGIRDSMKINLVTQVSDTFDFKIVPDQKKDTLYYWFKGAPQDSLQFEFPVADSTVVYTVKMKDLPKDTLALSPNQGRNLSLKKPFAIVASTPLVAADTNKIEILDKDSVAVKFSTKIDEINNQLDFDFAKAPDDAYQITLLPEAITDFFGNTNDTLIYPLRTKKLSEYGNMNVVLVDVPSYPIVLQLTTEKGDLIEEIHSEKERASYYFQHLDPGNYLMRIIFDVNNNKKWDTGDYLRKIQPEKILYYQGTIEVRANWEIEQTFTIKDEKYPDLPKTEVSLDSI